MKQYIQRFWQIHKIEFYIILIVLFLLWRFFHVEIDGIATNIMKTISHVKIGG